MRPKTGPREAEKGGGGMVPIDPSSEGPRTRFKCNIEASSKETGDKEKDKYRLAGKRVLLTYSRMPEEMTHEDVLECLIKMGVPFQYYLIGKENHAREGIHFHVLLEARLKKRFDYKNKHALDLFFDGRSHHGNYGKAIHYQSAVAYCCKNGDYVTDMPDVVDGKVLDPLQRFDAIYRAEGHDAASKWYLTNHASRAAGGKGLDKFLKFSREKEAIEYREADGRVEPAFTSLDHFNLGPIISKWRARKHQPPLFLVGDGGIGKTSFAETLAHTNAWKMLTICNREDLKRLDPTYHAIFFDDFVLKGFSRDELLNLLDTSAPKTIDVKYGSVNRRREVIEIFAMNRGAFQSFLEKIMNEDDLETQFARRMSPRDARNAGDDEEVSRVEASDIIPDKLCSIVAKSFIS